MLRYLGLAVLCLTVVTAMPADGYRQALASGEFDMALAEVTPADDLISMIYGAKKRLCGGKSTAVGTTGAPAKH